MSFDLGGVVSRHNLHSNAGQLLGPPTILLTSAQSSSGTGPSIEQSGKAQPAGAHEEHKVMQIGAGGGCMGSHVSIEVAT